MEFTSSHKYHTDSVQGMPQPNMPGGLYDETMKKTRGALDRFVDAKTMPFWSNQDTRNALISTMVPAGAALTAFAVFARDKDVVNWWQNIKKPSWAPKDVRLYSVMDILALAPLGYASYLVYKNGGGFDYTDTRFALGMYGANMALALATIPFVKKKCLGCLWKNTALVHLTAVGTAIAFYKIDQTAGLWMVPYALWTGFYAILTYSIHSENKAIKDI
ncbi:unnamed protein product [Cylicocyclus nassatus]|uniref:TspO/MBR family protein n=1 Tax=Cylicocyclus nassatus TaxID=53992 RepID=A0AA36GL74_CYLNA|nr:unnamed protein product [Cylicocyclus nassatus]